MIKTISLDVMGEPGSGGTPGCLKGCDGQALIEDQVIFLNTTFTDAKGNRVRISATVTNIVERLVSEGNPIYDTSESPPVAKNGHTYTLAYDTEDLPAGINALGKCDLYTDRLIFCADDSNNCCYVFSSDDFEGEGTEEDPIRLKENLIQNVVTESTLDAIKTALAACEFRTAVSGSIAAPGPNTKITAIYYTNGLGNEELAWSSSVGLPWTTDTALEAAINNPANGVPLAGAWDASGGRLKIESAIDFTRIVVCDSVSGATASVNFACEGPEGHDEDLKKLVRALGYDPAFVVAGGSDGGSGGSGGGGSGGGGSGGGIISTLTYSSIGQFSVAIPDNATKLRIESVGAGGTSSVGASVIAEIAIAVDGVIAATDSLVVSVGQAVNYTNPSPNYATGVFKGSYSRANALAVAGGGGAFGRINTGPALGQAYNGNATGGSGGNSGTMTGASGSLNNSTGTYVGAGGYGYEGGSASNTGGNGGTSFIHVSALVREFPQNEGRYADGDQPNTEGFTDFNGSEGRVQEEGYVKLIFSN